MDYPTFRPGPGLSGAVLVQDAGNFAVSGFGTADMAVFIVQKQPEMRLALFQSGFVQQFVYHVAFHLRVGMVVKTAHGVQQVVGLGALVFPIIAAPLIRFRHNDFLLGEGQTAGLKSC